MKDITKDLLKNIISASEKVAIKKKKEVKPKIEQQKPNVIVETKESFVYAPPKDKSIKVLNDPPTYNLPPEVLNNNCIDPKADPLYRIDWCNNETPEPFIGMKVGQTFQIGGYIHGPTSTHYFVVRALKDKDPFYFKNELALRKVREKNTRLR